MEKEIYDKERFLKEFKEKERKIITIKKIYFQNIILDFDHSFTLSLNKIHFKNCEFRQKIKINTSNEVDEELILESCIFNNDLDISECKFKKNVKFWQSSFNNVNFHNTTFNGLADFWSCTFNENVIFYKTDFLGTTVFSAANFKKAVLFTYTSISKVIIFRGTRFENGLDLSQAIISGNISLHDIRIKKFKAVDNTENNKIYENYITETGDIPFSNKRETFRILKQNFSKNGNEIDSIEYKKKEHETLFYELISNIKNTLLPVNIENLNRTKYIRFYFKKLFDKKSKRIKRFLNLIENIQNLIILFLNFISNHFGVSWFFGLTFISCIASIFFLLSITEIPEYYFTLNPKNWQWEHFKYFLEFLNPTHKFDYLNEKKLTPCFYIYDFFGRILVGYGIYQFVQAFRKYK